MGKDRQSSRSGSITKLYGNNVSTASLIYPVTLTNQTGTYGSGLYLDAGSAELGEQVFQVIPTTGQAIWGIPIAGGPSTMTSNVQVYHASGGPWAGFLGTTNPPAVQLPDGTGQGSTISSGTGPPTSAGSGTTLNNNTGAVGDVYYQRSACWLVAAAYSNNTAVSAIKAGSGTLLANTTGVTNGVIANGDLVVVVTGNTNASETMTIGSTAGITATSTDGGFTENDGTRYVKFWSHVIQSGDISSATIKASSTTNSAGNNRRMYIMVFRSPGGWTALSSTDGYGCATFATDGTAIASGSSNVSVSVTGPSTYPQPAIVVAAEYASTGGTFTPTFLFDNGNTSGNLTCEYGSAAGAFCQSKPGIGTNNSAAVSYPTGGSSVSMGAQVSGAKVAGMVMWTPATTSNPIIWTCTAAGSPGTWVQIL